MAISMLDTNRLIRTIQLSSALAAAMLSTQYHQASASNLVYSPQAQEITGLEPNFGVEGLGRDKYDQIRASQVVPGQGTMGLLLLELMAGSAAILDANGEPFNMKIVDDKAGAFAPIALEFVNRDLLPSHLDPEERAKGRGGMTSQDVESAHIMIVTESIGGAPGKSYVVLNQMPSGKLSGFRLGEGEFIRVLPLEFGKDANKDMLGFWVEGTGGIVSFYPLIDATTGSVVAPTGIGRVNEKLASNGKVARLVEFNDYAGPEFGQLQDKVAETERFSLPSYDEGLLDNGVPVPDIAIGRDGSITLTLADGSVVQVEPAQVSLDEEQGLGIEGYKLNEDGEWVEAIDTVMLGRVTLTLSEPDENGVRVATKIEVVGNYGEEEKIDDLKRVDPKYYGFKPGEVEIAVVEDGQVILTPTGEHETEIARWFFDTNEWTWHWDQLEQFEGGNPVCEFGKLWEMKGVNEVDREGAKRDDKKIFEFAWKDRTMTGFGVIVSHIYLCSGDGKKAIGAVLRSRNPITGVDLTPEIAASGVIDGKVYFLSANGELVSMKVDNLSFQIRYWGFNPFLK